MGSAIHAEQLHRSLLLCNGKSDSSRTPNTAHGSHSPQRLCTLSNFSSRLTQPAKVMANVIHAEHFSSRLTQATIIINLFIFFTLNEFSSQLTPLANVMASVIHTEQLQLMAHTARQCNGKCDSR